VKHNIVITRQIPNLGHNNAASLIKKYIEITLDEENVNERCFVSVMLTDNEGIHEINREFRGVDRPTDVLSFPMNNLVAEEFDASICERDLDTGDICLGDMVISVPQCEIQGEEFGHGFEREVCYLTVHSVLHLLGYDHVDEAEMKAQMRRKEKIIMGD